MDSSGECAGNELERQEVQGRESHPGDCVWVVPLPMHQLLKEKHSDYRAGGKWWEKQNRVFPPTPEIASLLNPSCFAPADSKDTVTNLSQVTGPSSPAGTPESSHKGSVLVLFPWEGGDSTENVTH